MYLLLGGESVETEVLSWCERLLYLDKEIIWRIPIYLKCYVVTVGRLPGTEGIKLSNYCIFITSFKKHPVGRASYSNLILEKHSSDVLLTTDVAVPRHKGHPLERNHQQAMSQIHARPNLRWLLSAKPP